MHVHSTGYKTPSQRVAKSRFRRAIARADPSLGAVEKSSIPKIPVASVSARHRFLGGICGNAGGSLRAAPRGIDRRER